MNKKLRQLLLLGLAALWPFAAAAEDASKDKVRIDSPQYGVVYNASRGEFSIEAKPSGKLFVPAGRLAGGVGKATSIPVNDSKFGVGQGLEIRFDSGHRSLIAIYPGLPFVLIKSQLHNSAKNAQELNKVELLSSSLDLGLAHDKIQTLGTGGLFPPAKNPGSYAFLALADPATRAGVVGGWLTHERGSGVLFSPVKDGVVSLQARIDYGCLRIQPGADAETETLAIGYFDDARFGLEAYADAIAKVYAVKLPPKQVGHCTWYMEKHGFSCDEKHLQELTAYASKNLKPFGFDFIQIDDGWQDGKSKNGPNKNFTTHRSGGAYRSGMKATADNIAKSGLIPGIWFMPFAGTWDDPFFADKQDWFVKTLDGKPYDTSWGGTCLDMTNPIVQNYVRDMVKRISNEWGYKFFKMDGYWTGSGTKQIYVNNGYHEDGMGDAVFHDKSKTNIEAMRMGTKLIREAVGPEVFLLGCCVSQNMRSFGGTFGLLDAMRVGPDTGADQIGAPHASRLWFLNGRVWWNDPDCVSVRKSVTIEQARLNASFTNMSDTLFYNSDWMPDFPADRLDIMRCCMTAHNLPSRPVDVFENQPARIWHLPAANRKERRDLVALYNWDKKKPLTISCPVDRIGLPKADEYVGFEFWTKKFIPPFKGTFTCDLSRGPVARIVSVKPVTGYPVLISTSRHMTQGIVDVTDETWDLENSRLSATSQLVADDPYEIRIVVPLGQQSWKAAKITVSAEDAAAGVKAELKQDGPKVFAVINSPASRKVKWDLSFERAPVSASPAKAVTNLQAKAGYGQFTLTWDETGDEGYRITRDDGKVFITMGNVFFDDSFTKAESISYSVEALNYEGNPGKPTSIKAVPAGIPTKPEKPTVYLEDLKLHYALNDYVKPSIKKNISGQPLSVGGVTYEHGLGVHARSWTHCAIPANSTRFVAVVGLDDKVKDNPHTSVVFEVYGDVKEMGEEPKLLGRSPELSKETIAEWSFDIELNSRYKELRLMVSDADDGIAGDHANWVDAGFVTGKTAANGVVPAAQLVDMSRRADELKALRWGMFICWSLSTFSGQEWRSDVKDVAYFRAKEVDPEQWVKTAKEAGMGYVLFRVKDQDGFCLWDTKTTDRKVTKAPLGRDVLGELRKACDKHGIKLALCFSQGEFSQHKEFHPAGGYTPEMQKAQLTELLTQYGPIEFLWCDHALGNGGLNHAKLAAFVKSFQPGCFVGFSGGDPKGADIRLDEETGAASLLADKPADGAASYRLAAFTYPILPAHQGGAVWYYSLPKHDTLCHPAEKLYSDYLDAVKHGNLFSLNVGPDYDGKLRAVDVATLRNVGEMIRTQAPESPDIAKKKLRRNQSDQKWRQDKFMILAFGGPTNDALADAYAKAGFNTVLTKVEHLDLCAKYGLRSVVKDATPAQAANFREHPGVYGWWVQDEPIKKEWVNVGQMTDAFHEADPHHPAYVNLAGWENLDAYFRIVKPWFLSFDVYQWWHGGSDVPSTDAYCSELERHRIAALKANVPLFCWVESNADWRYANGVAGAGYLADNAAMMRHSVWLALVHGSKGIQWFTAGLVFDKNGKLLRSGEDVKAINKELGALGPILMTLRCDKVYHTKPVPKGSVAISPDCEFASPDADVSFGIFTGDADMKHVIVMNREIKPGAINAMRNITVDFKKPLAIERFNVDTGSWEALAIKNGDGKYSISIDLLSGAGALIRCRNLNER
ncbi:MAG: hypothetical protein RL095_3866 [Verrucomicrobiota bacterium]|jgi:hypothetical protein